MGRESSVGIAGRSGDRILVRASFPESVQTGPAAHPLSCTEITGCLFRGCFVSVEWSTLDVYISTLLNESIEQNPSCEDNIISTIQEIPHILWNLKVRYCVHVVVRLFRIMNHINHLALEMDI